MLLWQLLAMNPRKINFFGRINLFALGVGFHSGDSKISLLKYKINKKDKNSIFILILNYDYNNINK